MSTPTPDGWLPTTVQTLLDRAGDDVARLEVALLAAWRPTTLLAHADLPGCVLRWHHQMTKRANSLLVLGPTRPRSTAPATSWYVRRAPAQAPLAMTLCPLPLFSPLSHVAGSCCKSPKRPPRVFRVAASAVSPLLMRRARSKRTARAFGVLKSSFIASVKAATAAASIAPSVGALSSAL